MLAATLVLLAFAAQNASDEIRVRSGPYQPSEATISVESNLVELAVTVRNSKGEAVAGLKGVDFELIDNKTPRRIFFFEEEHTQIAHVPDVTVDTAKSSAAIPAILNPPAEISAPASAPPRTIALFFDDHRAGVLIGRSKAAAEKLVQNLRANDSIGIFTASATVGVNFTHDKKSLLDAIAKIAPHPLPGERGFMSCPTLTAYEAYVIDQHIDPDAEQMAEAEAKGCITPCDPECEKTIPSRVAAAAANAWNYFRAQSAATLDVVNQIIQLLSHASGDRVLVLLSPGFLAGGMERETSAMTDAALRAHIPISGLDSEGLLGGATESPESFGAFTGARYQWARKTLGQRQLILSGVMADLAAATGGRFIGNNNDLIEGLRRLATAPEVSYRLAFAPGEPDNKYHKLTVRLKNAKNEQLQFRPGYFSTPAKESAQQRIDHQVASSDTRSEIPAVVRAMPGLSALQIEIVVDAKRVPFVEKSGRRVQELTFVTVVRDAQGNYVNGAETVMDFELTPEKFQEIKTSGIKSTASFPLASGSYTIREVVREAVHNSFFAGNTSASMP